MATQDSQQDGRPEPQQAAQETPLPVLGLVESLGRLCEPGTPAETLTRGLLRGLVALSDASYAGFWRLDPRTGNLTLADEVMPKVSEQTARDWAAPLSELAAGVIQQAIIRYRALSQPADGSTTGQTCMALGLPVRGEPAVAGCVIVVVQEGSPILSDAGVALLRLIADTGMVYSLRRVAAHYEGFYKSLSGGWELIGEMLAFSGPLEMAQVLVNRIRLSFGADRASLGFVRREKVTVVAVSNEDIVDKRSNIVRLIQAAQSEAAVADEPRLYIESAETPSAEPELAASPQHHLLAQNSGAKVVYSVPLREKNETIGVLTLEFSNTPFTEATRRLIDLVAGQTGPILGLARQNDRGIVKRSGDGLAAAARWVFGKKHPWRWVALVGGAVLVAAALLVKCTFNVTGNCVLQPSRRHIYAAPFDSTIRFADVRPGDTVSQGPDPRGVRRRRGPDATAQGAERLQPASPRKCPPTWPSSRSPSSWRPRPAGTSLQAEIDLLKHHLDRAVLRADFPGIVISGNDLRQHIGRSVRMGEQLVEVATLDELVLEIEVEQGDINYVKAGQTGYFTTKARPSVETPFTINLVRPAPEVRDRASVYIAEATRSPTHEGWLRPGMEGAAKVKIDRRNVTWVAAAQARQLGPPASLVVASPHGLSSQETRLRPEQRAGVRGIQPAASAPEAAAAAGRQGDPADLRRQDLLRPPGPHHAAVLPRRGDRTRGPRPTRRQDDPGRYSRRA